MGKCWVDVVFCILIVLNGVYSKRIKADCPGGGHEDCRRTTKKCNGKGKGNNKCSTTTMMLPTSGITSARGQKTTTTTTGSITTTPVSETTTTTSTTSTGPTTMQIQTSPATRSVNISINYTSTETSNKANNFSDKGNAGTVAGIVLALGILLGFVIFVLLRYKRQKCMKKGTTTEEKRHIYNHACLRSTDAAISDTASSTSAIQEEHHHYHEIAIRDMQDFTESASKAVSSKPLRNDIKNDISLEQNNFFPLDPQETGRNPSNIIMTTESQTTCEQGNSNYSVLDPNETGFNRTKTVNPTSKYELDQPLSSRTDISDKTSKGKLAANDRNYTILDPNETGYNRSDTSDTSLTYELAQPLSSVTENFKKISKAPDQYTLNTRDLHDSDGFVSQIGGADNVYNHIQDGEYDTTVQRRKTDVGNDEYDHFCYNV